MYAQKNDTNHFRKKSKKKTLTIVAEWTVKQKALRGLWGGPGSRYMKTNNFRSIPEYIPRRYSVRVRHKDILYLEFPRISQSTIYSNAFLKLWSWDGIFFSLFFRVELHFVNFGTEFIDHRCWIMAVWQFRIYDKFINKVSI